MSFFQKSKVLLNQNYFRKCDKSRKIDSVSHHPPSAKKPTPSPQTHFLETIPWTINIRRLYEYNYETLCGLWMDIELPNE